MNSKKFLITLYCFLFLSLSKSYLYSYIEYSLEKEAQINYNIFYITFIASIFGLFGLIAETAKSTIIPLGLLFIVVSELAMMFMDIVRIKINYNSIVYGEERNDEKEEQTGIFTYSNLYIFIIANFIGWMMITFGLIQEKKTNIEKGIIIATTITNFVMNNFLQKFERKNLITQGPSSYIISICNVFLAYFISS